MRSSAMQPNTWQGLEAGAAEFGLNSGQNMFCLSRARRHGHAWQPATCVHVTAHSTS